MRHPAVLGALAAMAALSLPLLGSRTPQLVGLLNRAARLGHVSVGPVILRGGKTLPAPNDVKLPKQPHPPA